MRERRDGMKNRFTICGISMAVGLALLLWLPAQALAIYGGQGGGKEDGEGKPTQVRVHDRTLVDQDGRKVRFASDVIGDRFVVIDTFYTTCVQICPILSAIFMELQDQLGSRLGGRGGFA